MSNIIDTSREFVPDGSRRNFLFAATAIVAGLLVPDVTLAASREANKIYVPYDVQNFWDHPREIWLARNATGQEAKICYWRDGKLDTQGYIQACHLLKDVQVDQAVQMDVGLLNLLRAIQGWLVYYGINQPIEVTSGYRSPLTNSRTEGAAKNSLHTQGRAVDIRIPGIPTAYLSKLAAAFSGGGVGFYAGKKFVHADTGRVRYWRG